MGSSGWFRNSNEGYLASSLFGNGTDKDAFQQEIVFNWALESSVEPEDEGLELWTVLYSEENFFTRGGSEGE